MTRKDRDALKRAIAMARAMDGETAQRVDLNLKYSPWQEAAEHAAYQCQMRTLKLRPWQCPPMDSDDEISPKGMYGGTPQEVGLRRRMIVLGLSVFEPDPLSAIAEAEAARNSARASNP